MAKPLEYNPMYGDPQGYMDIAMTRINNLQNEVQHASDEDSRKDLERQLSEEKIEQLTFLRNNQQQFQKQLDEYLETFPELADYPSEEKSLEQAA